MTEPKAAEWIARVEETFQRLRYAGRDVQEKACQSIEQEHGGDEPAAKLRELFENERRKIRALADKAGKVVAKP
jgi:hypothetical protein